MNYSHKFFFLCLLIGLLGIWSFSGCERQDPISPVGEKQELTGNLISPVFFGKEPTPTARYKEAWVTPDSGAHIRINGKNINEASLNVHPGNVTDSLLMTFIKLSRTSNTYHVLPFGMDLPNGASLTLCYDHSAMPYGVSEDDLQIFYLTDTDTIPLPSHVKKRKMEVNTTIYHTGEFSLGAYDMDGKLQLIEGEFGLRKEDWINPKKGGTIRLGGGSKVVIPPNALNERTLIGIIATRKTIRGISDNKEFTFTPHGTQFNVPIKVVLSWEEFEGQNVTLYYFNEHTQQWEVSGEGVWDENNKTVTLFLYHFSRYALVYA